MIVIGDEILAGFVRDTNSGWLAERLRRGGIPLDRVITVPDDLPAIGEALASELTRARPRVVFTSGGIGSTPDDRTMEAIARHLGVPLVPEPTIRGMMEAIVRRARERGDGLKPEHEQAIYKMAQAPQNARALPGVVGFAPGVRIDVDGGSHARDGATVVVLPGVPSEFRNLVTGSVEPELLDGFGTPLRVAELRHPYPESLFAPLLAELDEAYPTLHIGSYPGRECLLRLQGDDATVASALRRLEQHAEQLRSDPAAQRMARDWQAHWPDDEAGLQDRGSERP